MYVPPAFARHETGELFDLVEAHSFGLLVSQHDGQPTATHLPLIVERAAPPQGRLLGHFARANPQWQSLEGQDVLCVFSGPHAYVSPTWYGRANMVPTWNYVAAHVVGRCTLLDEDASAEVLTRMVATYERSLPAPWSIDSGSEFFQRLARQIVAFRLDVTRIEGKWKLGQNHPAEVRTSAAAHLAEQADPQAQEIAALMRRTLEGPGK